ncbi:unnamed protein product [Caretta caretta]
MARTQAGFGGVGAHQNTVACGSSRVTTSRCSHGTALKLTSGSFGLCSSDSLGPSDAPFTVFQPSARHLSWEFYSADLNPCWQLCNPTYCCLLKGRTCSDFGCACVTVVEVHAGWLCHSFPSMDVLFLLE